MSRRTNGTGRPGSLKRRLEPLGAGPWLTDKLPVRVWMAIGLAAIGGVLVALVLGPQTDPDAAALHLLGWLLIYAGVLAVFSILGLCLEGSWRAAHQYCPDCLSHMTRGARVCPFCGFREDASGVSNGTRSPKRTGMRRG